MTDRDEWRYEVDRMTDLEREESCGHTRWHGRGDCPDCGTSRSSRMQHSR